VKRACTRTKYFAGAFGVALVLFVTAVPAAGACCLGKPLVTTAMHASMPCCAGSCRLAAAIPTRDNDINVISAPSVARPSPLIVAIAAVPPLQTESLADATETPVAIAAAPAFLAHHQFRI
jgi:hypothetical protein